MDMDGCMDGWSQGGEEGWIDGWTDGGREGWSEHASGLDPPIKRKVNSAEPSHELEATDLVRSILSYRLKERGLIKGGLYENFST